MVNFIYLLVVFLFFITSSCGKKSLTEPLPVEKSLQKDTTKTLNKPPLTDGFKAIEHNINISNHLLNSVDRRNYYLGSIWSLSDTTLGLKLADLSKKQLSKNLYILMGILSFVCIFPSFNNMTNYVRSNSNKELLSYDETISVFQDYAEIQSSLGYNDDVKVIMKLVSVNDSTVLRAKYGSYRARKEIYSYAYLDIVEVQDLYTEEYVNGIIKEGYSPYILSGVNYGIHYILMGESDYPRTDFDKVIDKIFENELLSEEDKKILVSSKLLIYGRDGQQDSFIQYSSGLEEIVNSCTSFRKRFKDSPYVFTYPLEYNFWKLEDYSTLKYFHRYKTLIKQKATF